MGFIDRLQNCLTQTLLPLCSEERLFDKLPSLRTRGHQQSTDDMSAHAANFVLVADGLAENIEDLVGRRPGGINHRRQQPADCDLIAPVPAVNMRSPGGEPRRAEDICLPSHGDAKHVVKPR